MVDFSKFASISPYTDEEAVAALSKVAGHPLLAGASQYFFPDKDPGYLSELLKGVRSIDDFQVMVMSKVVTAILAKTARNFSYDGISNILNQKGRFLALSNHRDIILDPAITQIVLRRLLSGTISSPILS